MMDRYPLKEYPIVGACGLNCSLCPRHHTRGASRCPGCCGPDFWQKHPGCGFITCCVKERHLETCAQCPDWTECEKVARLLDLAKHQDSFISRRPLAANFTFIQKYGIKEFARRETGKERLLRHLIDNYDDGRSKNFYCIACQLIPLDKLRKVVENVELKMTEDTDSKEKAKLTRAAINNAANNLQIDLKLRKDYLPHPLNPPLL